MLKINGLTFGYGKSSPVLGGVSLELGRGETGILLGRNGSGKTTLFKNILGINTPAGGELLMDGRDIRRMTCRERAAKIAYVPQDIRFGDISVYDAVLAGRSARFGFSAGKKDHDVVRQTLADMGLEGISRKSAAELSGGERQKTAIARALAQEPELLIFDEPTGNLDIGGGQLIIREARRLSREKNIAVLSSLHDLNEAMRFGDKFFFLGDGRIKYAGGKALFTPDILRDIFGIEVRIIDSEGEKYIVAEGA